MLNHAVDEKFHEEIFESKPCQGIKYKPTKRFVVEGLVTTLTPERWISCPLFFYNISVLAKLFLFPEKQNTVEAIFSSVSY